MSLNLLYIYFPAEFFKFNFTSQCKIGWPPGRLDRVFITSCLWVYQEIWSMVVSGRFQRVILNGRNSSWTPVLVGISQDSILGSLLFLDYINDLPNELTSKLKLCADDTSLFSTFKYKNENGDILHNDRLSISKWACNWKMLFNLDPIKPAQKVLFSRIIFLKYILNGKFNPRMDTIRVFIPKLGHFFRFSKKGRGSLPLPP